MPHPAPLRSSGEHPVPPRRAARPPAALAGSDANVNRYIAAYIMGVANRLASGASAHYRKKFNLGMSEWRTIMAIGTSDHRIVREVAEKADIDYAAASKSLRILQERRLVEMEQTSRRGRAAIGKLTPEGLVIYRQLLESSRRRQKRLLAQFSAAEVGQLWSLLRRIEEQVPYMNADS
jgi:DNA-binding MarR family transcriptional regulator